MLRPQSRGDPALTPFRCGNRMSGLCFFLRIPSVRTKNAFFFGFRLAIGGLDVYLCDVDFIF